MLSCSIRRGLVLLGALASVYACNVYTEDLLAGESRDTGGDATGGEATGGAATGGSATGGAATGGKQNGGAATGGAATGGSPGGGSPAGGTAATGGSTGGNTGGTPPEGGAGYGGNGGEAGSGDTTGSGGVAGAANGGTGGGPTGGTAGQATVGECGDGTTDPDEDCDDEGESATCDADCTVVECGDGLANATAGEDCDDAGESATCNADCTDAECGDGVANATAGEDCDDAGESATCNTDCTDVECGDGITNPTAGEECEPSLVSDCTTDDCKYSYWHYLVNRFSFEGSGTAAVDSVGSTGDGLIYNTSLTGTGKLVLAGGTSDQFASLPNGLASRWTNATFEVWVDWPGVSGDAEWWQRIFDFGNSDAGEGQQGDDGASYLFLSPHAWDDHMRVAFSPGGKDSESALIEVDPLPAGNNRHVAVVVDDDLDTITLYVQGASVGSTAFTDSLSSLTDVNNWIGRSQFALDPDFKGSIDEFRIYNVALSADQVMDSFVAGPNP